MKSKSFFVGRHAEGVTFFVFNLVKYWREGWGVRVNSQEEVASGVPYVGKKPKYVTITFQASLVYANLCTLHVSWKWTHILLSLKSKVDIVLQQLNIFFNLFVGFHKWNSGRGWGRWWWCWGWWVRRSGHISFIYSLPNCCRGSFYMYDTTRTTCNQVMSPQFFTKKIYQKIPNLPDKLTDYLEFSEEVGDLETDWLTGWVAELLAGWQSVD